MPKRVAVVTVVLLGFGCGTSPGPVRNEGVAKSTRQPNVLFISLDTVRRDALGVFRDDGAGPSSTPHLDAFARDAVIFDDAVAPMPFTLASHMSMFTGFYPDVHGVSKPKRQLAQGVTTLPSVLQDSGYHTVGFYSNDWMKPSFGFDRGFDRYERIAHELTFADRLNEKLLDTIDATPPAKPWFVFLHYFDAHSDNTTRQSTLPYYAPSPFLDDLGIHPTDQRFCQGEACATAYLLNLNRSAQPLSTGEIQTLTALYERGIRYLDDRMGALFQNLRERGQYDDTLIVVIADHGEEFREHGRLIHSQPYVESVAIPLMIKLPGQQRAGERIGVPAETIDLMPTVLSALGLPVPDTIQGLDQLAPIETVGAHDAGPSQALAQDKHNFQRYGLYTPSHVLVFDYKTDHSELYDRQADPGLLNDLADTQPALRDALHAQLDSLVRESHQRAKDLIATEVEAGAMTREEEELLKSLGYLNG